MDKMICVHFNKDNEVLVQLYLFLQFRSAFISGRNFIKEIPPELGNLLSNYLVLCDNKIQSVPPLSYSEYFQEFMCTHTSLLRDYCLAFTPHGVYVEKN